MVMKLQCIRRWKIYSIVKREKYSMIFVSHIFSNFFNISVAA